MVCPLFAKVAVLSVKLVAAIWKLLNMVFNYIS